MTLADLRLGQFATIEWVDAHDPGVQRLMELGLVEGTGIRFTNAALGGDPMEFHFTGTAVSLRRDQASKFRVSCPEIS